MIRNAAKRPAGDIDSDSDDFDACRKKSPCTDADDCPAARYIIPPYNNYYLVDDLESSLFMPEEYDTYLDPDSAVYGQRVQPDKFSMQFFAFVQKDSTFGLFTAGIIQWEDLNRGLNSSVVVLPFADTERTRLLLRYEYLPQDLRAYMESEPPKAIMYKSGSKSYAMLPRQGWASCEGSEAIQLKVVSTVYDHDRKNTAVAHPETLNLVSGRRCVKVTFLVT